MAIILLGFVYNLPRRVEVVYVTKVFAEPGFFGKLEVVKSSLLTWSSCNVIRELRNIYFVLDSGFRVHSRTKELV